MPPFISSLTLILFGAAVASTQSGMAQSQSKLFFREDWKEIAAALPVTQDHVSNPHLILTLYGPGADAVKKSNHPEIPNDPFYIWSGECKGSWAVGLRHRSEDVDLSAADARIKIRSRQSGFRMLRLILKLGNGSWLVSDAAQDYTEDWVEKEFTISSIRWRKLNIENVTEGQWVEKPDLRSVVEIGFTDLMAGGGTPASSRLDWIEVWGRNTRR
jgi:hypothetical protein